MVSMRSVEEIKSAIESLRIDRDRIYNDTDPNHEEDRDNFIRSLTYRINTLKWVLLERTTWL